MCYIVRHSCTEHNISLKPIMKYLSFLSLGFLSGDANSPGPLCVARVGFGRQKKNKENLKLRLLAVL